MLYVKRYSYTSEVVASAWAAQFVKAESLKVIKLCIKQPTRPHSVLKERSQKVIQLGNTMVILHIWPHRVPAAIDSVQLSTSSSDGKVSEC